MADDSLSVVSVVLPAHDGAKALRIRVRVPDEIFEEFPPLDDAQKGEVLTAAVGDAYADLQDGVVPDATSALVPPALRILVNNKLITQRQFDEAIEALSGSKGGKASGSKGSKGSKGKTSKTSKAVSFEDYGDEEDDEDDDDDEDEEDEEDDDDMEPYVITAGLLSGEIEGGQEALGGYLESLEDQDLAAVAEMLETFNEWVDQTPKAAKNSAVAKSNPWLIDLFIDVARSGNQKTVASRISKALGLIELIAEGSEEEEEEEEEEMDSESEEEEESEEESEEEEEETSETEDNW